VGFTIVVLESPKPTAIRRTVSVAQAVFENSCTIDGMTARLIHRAADLPDNGDIGVLLDPGGIGISKLNPDLLIDAIMAKRNCGTTKNMARRVVALGPGFRAPEDVHAVVETLRGHNLGRVITDGEAAPDTGTPGEIGGETRNRIIRSPGEGVFNAVVSIGDFVRKGQFLGDIRGSGKGVYAQLDGVLRGSIHPRVPVVPAMKIGDIDPRAMRENCFSISDKSLAIGGGVLEAALAVSERPA
jgi:xanthine dehydrogenase accessory factor